MNLRIYGVDKGEDQATDTVDYVQYLLRWVWGLSENYSLEVKKVHRVQTSRRMGVLYYQRFERGGAVTGLGSEEAVLVQQANLCRQGLSRPGVGEAEGIR